MLKNLKVGNDILKIKNCETFFSKMKGLMFTFKLDKDKALFFSSKKDSMVEHSIHMFFVFYSINIYWLDKDFIVVDKVLAKPFRPWYQPSKLCRYILETHKDVDIKVGQKLKFY